MRFSFRAGDRRARGASATSAPHALAARRELRACFRQLRAERLWQHPVELRQHLGSDAVRAPREALDLTQADHASVAAGQRGGSVVASEAFSLFGE
jgi:hypothetical protein